MKGVSKLLDISSYSTYPGYFLYIKRTKADREIRTCSRSEDFDLTGSRLIEVELYLLYLQKSMSKYRFPTI